jgi:hypothetical protein
MKTAGYKEKQMQVKTLNAVVTDTLCALLVTLSINPLKTKRICFI